MTPLERVVARDEIRQLAYRYADAVDRRDIDLMVSLFAPDARFGSYGTGAEACRKLSEESLSQVGVAVLLVANHIIDFDVDEPVRLDRLVDAGSASGAPSTGPGAASPAESDAAGDTGSRSASGSVWCLGLVDDHQEGFIEQLIKYEDSYVRVGGQWLFARRRHLLWYGTPRWVSPLDQEPAKWPRSQVGRGSIPHSDPSWQAFWQRHS